MFKVSLKSGVCCEFSQKYENHNKGDTIIFLHFWRLRDMPDAFRAVRLQYCNEN